YRNVTGVQTCALPIFAPYLDREDFKTVTYQPSEEGVVQDPMTLQVIKVYSANDPEKVINMIGNGNIDLKYKHITPADIIASMNRSEERRVGKECKYTT